MTQAKYDVSCRILGEFVDDASRVGPQIEERVRPAGCRQAIVSGHGSKMSDKQTSVEVKTSGPSYLGWRGKLLAELALQVRHIPRKRRNLINRPITFEMCHELNDGLEQARTFSVLPALRQAAELLVCRCKHLKALQRCHRKREVALCVVQALDIGGHGGNGMFGLDGAAADSFDFAEEELELFLGAGHTLNAVIRGGDESVGMGGY